jgi:hypothetical protein
MAAELPVSRWSRGRRIGKQKSFSWSVCFCRQKGNRTPAITNCAVPFGSYGLSIVPINRRKDGGWHWVVFVPNGARPYILDPMAGKGRRRYDFRGINARGFYIYILFEKPRGG